MREWLAVKEIGWAVVGAAVGFGYNRLATHFGTT
jgi:hypothetical protein